MAPDLRRPGLRGSSPHPARRLLGLLLAGVLAASTAAADTDRLCTSTHLTLFGADLESGRLLLGPGGTDDLVLLDLAAGTAVAVPEARGGGVLGGSVAAGPVVAARSCGPDCLSAFEWGSDGWRPLGESLLADARSTLVETTRDRKGIAWLVLRAESGPEGRAEIAAHRLGGREWMLEARAAAGAIGSPLASPSPRSPAGIVVGDLEIVAGEPGARVLEDRPRAVSLEGAQIHWLTADRPLLVTGTGDLYLWTGEARASWRPVRWRPRGLDAGSPVVDVLPATIASRRSFVWNEERTEAETRLHLVEWAEDGFRTVLSLDDGLRTSDGSRLPFRQVLRLEDGSWVLVAGCVQGSAGPGVAYLLLDAGGIGGPVVTPIERK